MSSQAKKEKEGRRFHRQNKLFIANIWVAFGRTEWWGGWVWRREGEAMLSGKRTLFATK